jgi:FtsH-binding integral membrane protein
MAIHPVSIQSQQAHALPVQPKNTTQEKAYQIMLEVGFWLGVGLMITPGFCFAVTITPVVLFSTFFVGAALAFATGRILFKGVLRENQTLRTH